MGLMRLPILAVSLAVLTILDSVRAFSCSKVAVTNLRHQSVIHDVYNTPMSSQRTPRASTSSSLLMSKKDTESEDDVIDLEYDFLNLDVPLSLPTSDTPDKKKETKKSTGTSVSDLRAKEGADKLIVAYNELRISPEMILDESTGESIPKPPRRALLKRSAKYDKDHKRNWPNWDEFMEEEFGDLDAPLNVDQNWMYDARNAIEQKRGYAIWSKKSTKDIQKEVRKAVAGKAMNIPPSVAMIIRKVHLEKTTTLKEIRKEDELGAIEYRKWMIEQRQKSKKDPLPQAKCEISKTWLEIHPTSNMGLAMPSSRAKMAPPRSNENFYSQVDNPYKKGNIVMDDYVVPLPDTSFSSPGSTSSSSNGSGAAKSSADVSPEAKKNGNATAITNTTMKGKAGTKGGTNALITRSMLNWDKSESEMPKETVTTAAKADRGSKKDLKTFVCDGEEMFIASSTGNDASEFYVVL